MITQHVDDEQHGNTDKQRIHELQEEINELIASVNQGITRIQSANTYIETLAQLNSDIRSALREINLKIQQLEIIITTCITGGDDDERIYQSIVNELRKKSNELSFQQRYANEVYNKKAAVLYRKHQRDLLLARQHHPGTSVTKTKGASGSSATVYKQTSGQVTDSLKRTQEILSQQLARSSHSMDTLAISQDKFKGAVTAQKGYEEEVKKSGTLIKFLEWQEKYDNYITMGAFIFFCLVCLYIFNKRIPILSLIYNIIKYIISSLFVFGAKGVTTIQGQTANVPVQQQIVQQQQQPVQQQINQQPIQQQPTDTTGTTPTSIDTDNIQVEVDVDGSIH
jgi:hypothetical protein